MIKKFFLIVFCVCTLFWYKAFTSVYKPSGINNLKIDTMMVEKYLPTIIEHKSKESKKIIKKEKKIKLYNKRYHLSKKGKDFIKQHETCVLKAYNDPDPKRRSVGWGHQIQPGENLEIISQKKADELFEKDIQWVNDAINRLISKNDKRFKYSQGFIDGLGSLIYNCGERGVTLTEFYSRWQNCRYDKNIGNINKSDLDYTLAAVKTSRISAPGHIKRRHNEYKLMSGLI